jgi:hypothetical protein
MRAFDKPITAETIAAARAAARKRRATGERKAAAV